MGEISIQVFLRPGWLTVPEQVPDVTPPVTTITDGPVNGSTITDPTPTFEFESSEADSTFEYRIDGGAWTACTSPLTVPDLDDDAHTFEVRAIDDVGNVALTPASRAFTVDATGPTTTITSGPSEGSTTGDPTPTFEFEADDPDATFEYRLDPPTGWTPCTSPLTIPAMDDEGGHLFEVRATDEFGNVGTAQRNFFYEIAYADQVLADEPIYYWPNASAFPIANAGTGGTADYAADGATANVTGPLSSGDTKAFSTDGVDDSPTPGTVDLTGQIVTVEFWMDIDLADAVNATSNADNPQIGSYGNPAAVGRGGFHIKANGTTGKWQIDNYATRREFPPSLSSDGWRHYAIVIDNTQGDPDDVIKVYVNGVAQTLTTVAGDASSADFATQTFYLGRDFGGRYCPAKFAHVALYTSALSGARVLAHYDAAT